MLKLKAYNASIVQDNCPDGEDILPEVPTESVPEIDQTLQGGKIKELGLPAKVGLNLKVQSGAQNRPLYEKRFRSSS
ncbi:hypothetical protein AbraCBS73388_004653 [Aspergillus brasiliensis]|uniref:Uncharacterized protein n=1 Tax=Aspergillus brasiliensis TaxID=319629 RepID=A0A9W5Z1K7_9EURO|nr:hypothetical protein AbraCBS73388_004653 [Aspergillus brasiliensis]